MLGKIEGRRRRGKTEDKVVGWYHQLSGHEFEQTPGDGEGQGKLGCCWLTTRHSKNEDHGIRSHHFMGGKESDMTELLN